MSEPAALTPSQLAGHDTRCADQDRTLAAMHDLEAALGAAAPGRESSWLAAVLAALIVLDEATDDEYANASQPDSLLADVKRTQPRLRTRVRGLQAQYAHLRQTISSMRAELATPHDDDPDYADVRQRLAWLLTALRHQRARESDLIYEAYYDAFHADLGTDATPADEPLPSQQSAPATTPPSAA
jgi:septal ring factor EnvC (AmiA/AmiB activator)